METRDRLEGRIARVHRLEIADALLAQAGAGDSDRVGIAIDAEQLGALSAQRFRVPAITESGVDGALRAARRLEYRGEQDWLVVVGHTRKHSAPSGIPNGAERG